MNIEPKRLKRIVREERLRSFLKSHGVRKEQIDNPFIDECHDYYHQWTEEELAMYTEDDNTSFQIKDLK